MCYNCARNTTPEMTDPSITNKHENKQPQKKITLSIEACMCCKIIVHVCLCEEKHKKIFECNNASFNYPASMRPCALCACSVSFCFIFCCLFVCLFVCFFHFCKNSHSFWWTEKNKSNTLARKLIHW